MKYKEKALHLIKEIVIKKPFELFFKITSNNQGMNQILTILNSNEKLYTPGELAKISNLTTARIAVVIKKLIKLGYVEKIRSMTDARVSYIVITLKGKTFIEEKNDELLKSVHKVIEDVGVEEFEQFIKLSIKIKASLEK